MRGDRTARKTDVGRLAVACVAIGLDRLRMSGHPRDEYLDRGISHVSRVTRTGDFVRFPSKSFVRVTRDDSHIASMRPDTGTTVPISALLP